MGLIVESMFDGMSCGQIALNQLGITVDKYYAYEIDKHAIKVTQHNYPNTIQLGSVTDWREHDIKPDIILAGSPCQDLSRIKSKDGKGLAGDKSSLFYDFYDNLQFKNPKHFLLENVVMSDKDENRISSMLGVSPILINSADFSAQDRPRLYWTNIEVDEIKNKCSLVINDIKQPIEEIEEKYFINDPCDYIGGDNKVIAKLHTHNELGKRRYMDMSSRVQNVLYKCPTLTAVSGGGQHKKIFDEGRVRKLTPTEYEALQTVPEGYTSIVSDSQRYKMLGNGWTIEVIKHILKNIK